MNLTADLLKTTLDNAGIVLPADAERALDTLTAIRDQTTIDPAAEAAADPTPITTATAAKRVQKLALALASRDHVAAAVQVLERGAVDDFIRAIRAHSLDLIDQARTSFDQAAAVLHQAGQLLEPGATREDAWAGGPEALTTHENLAGSAHVLNQIRAARTELGKTHTDSEREVARYIARADGKQALIQAVMLFGYQGAPGWHRLTAAGFVLRLNTPEEARKIEHDAEHYDQRAAEERAEIRRQANRDPLRDAHYERVLG